MQTIIPSQIESKRPLRAVVEFVDGEVLVFPVADSDVERAAILDALRVYFGETERRSGE